MVSREILEPKGRSKLVRRGAEVHDFASLQCCEDLGFPEERLPISWMEPKAQWDR
jgi:hypothetical protein